MAPGGTPKSKAARRYTQVLGIALLLACAAWSDEPTPTQQRVAVVYGATDSHRTAAAALARELARAGMPCRRFELPAAPKRDHEAALRKVRDYAPTAVAAGGTAATVWARSVYPHQPVIHFLVPNTPDAPFSQSADDHHLAGVSADVDPRVQIDWIRETAPDVRHLAILHSSRTVHTVDALKNAARAKNLKIAAIRADKDKFPEAIDALNHTHCDGVLMIPDAHVYNSPNVQRLLLWGVRNKRPVWTFAPNVVRAGAYAAIYAKPEDVGEHAARTLIAIARGADPDDLGLLYPRETQRAVNLRTAKLINRADQARSLPPEVTRFAAEED